MNSDSKDSNYFSKIDKHELFRIISNLKTAKVLLSSLEVNEDDLAKKTKCEKFLSQSLIFLNKTLNSK